MRWKTAVTNDRRGPRRELMASPYKLRGFNDSGAHNRNMAFQDGALQMQAHPERTMERAVRRLTGETAEWFGLDVGTIAEGKVADITIIDPAKLQAGLSQPIELVEPRLDDEMRMVKRSDEVVRHVITSGRGVARVPSGSWRRRRRTLMKPLLASRDPHSTFVE